MSATYFDPVESFLSLAFSSLKPEQQFKKK